MGAAASAPDSAGPAKGPRQLRGQQPSTSGRPAQGGPQDDEALRDVKDFGKSAIAWLKGAVPWLRSDDPDGEATAAPADDSVAWSAAAGGTVGPGATGGRFPAGEATTGPLQPGANAGINDDSTARSSRHQGYESNLLREAVAMIKEMLAHPMTWLVVAIFVIGGFAMSLADRRPK